MSVEHIAIDIGATPAHKRTEVPTKTELAKERSKSLLQCRREADDDKFFMSPPPPPAAVLITKAPDYHKYSTDCNQKAHMEIMCPFQLKQTCRKCVQLGPNMISSGRPPKKAVRQ